MGLDITLRNGIGRKRSCDTLVVVGEEGGGMLWVLKSGVSMIPGNEVGVVGVWGEQMEGIGVATGTLRSVDLKHRIRFFGL